MKLKCCAIVVLLGFCSSLYASQPLDSILKLRLENETKMDWVDRRMGKSLNKLTSSSNQALGQVDAEIKKLSQLRQEYKLRQEFYDRLAFMLEARYKGGNLKLFMKKTLLHLAQIELQNLGANSPLWKNYAYLGKAIGDVSERNENILDFIKSYVSTNGLSNPVNPEEFVLSRSYSNGLNAEAAKSGDKSKLGELVEKRQNSWGKIMGTTRHRIIDLEKSFLEPEPKPMEKDPSVLQQPIKVTVRATNDSSSLDSEEFEKKSRKKKPTLNRTETE